MSFIIVGAITILAAAVVALRLGDNTEHRAKTGINLATLTGLVLLTIGAWTALTDTHNITHWALKILITLTATTIIIAAAITLRTNPQRDADQETR